MDKTELVKLSTVYCKRDDLEILLKDCPCRYEFAFRPQLFQEACRDCKKESREGKEVAWQKMKAGL